MKKILVIGTGGTVASVKTKGGLRPAYTTAELISFFPEVRQIADIEGKVLFNLDSTNMQPHHWSEIAKEIGRQYDNYDGFVITHGTDTMQYTASALSFMLHNLGKPVVLTGSVKPIGKGSDARQNFLEAVVVATSGVRDVCVVFHGKIIKGCKARKITNEATKMTNENLGVYSSINYRELNLIDHLTGEIIGELRRNGITKIVYEKGYKFPKTKGKFTVLPKVVDADVAVVKLHPGLRPETFDKLSGFKCIIIEAYGPGNIPFMENSLLGKIKLLTKKGIPVFVTTQNPFGEVDMTLYEVGQKAMKAGAIPCNDMTTETAIVKLMWVLGNFDHGIKTIRRMMRTNFVGEIRV